MKLFFLLGLISSLVASVSGYTCTDFKSTGLPCLEIQRCDSEKAQTGGLVNQLSGGQGKATAVTKFESCYDDDKITFGFFNYNQNYFSSYEYDSCNDNVFNSDVVELFIAPWSEEEPTPSCYSELDVSPYNKIFESGIYSPNLNHTGVKNYLIDCGSSGVVSTTHTTPSLNDWYESLDVPWSVIDTPYGCPVSSAKRSESASKVYRMNVYRVNELSAVSTCSSSTCEYMAWSPTGCTPPAFHEPSKFGYAILI